MTGPAISLGCTCPVEVNAHGKGQKLGKATVFWTDDNCPIDHWGQKEEKK